MTKNAFLKGILVILVVFFIVISGLRPAKIDSQGNLQFISLGYEIDEMDNKLFGNPFHTNVIVEKELVDEVVDENERARIILENAKEKRKEFKKLSDENGFMDATFYIYSLISHEFEMVSVKIKYDITVQEIVNAYLDLHSKQAGFNKTWYPSIVAETDMFSTRLNFSNEINFMSAQEEKGFLDGLAMAIDDYEPEINSVYLEVKGKYEYDSNNYFIGYDENIIEKKQ